MKTMAESHLSIEQVREREYVDKVGFFLSGLCAVHCLLTPFAAIFAPALFLYLGQSAFHKILFAGVLSVGILSFVRCYFSHRNLLPLILGSIGIAILGWGAFHPHAEHLAFHSLISTFIHSGQNILGSSMLLFAHWRNIQSCRCLRTEGENCSHRH